MGLFGVSLADIAAGAKKTAGTIYDYATPGKGSSRLTDSGAAHFAPSSPTITVKSPNRTPVPTTVNGQHVPTANDTQAIINAIMAASRAYTPPKVYAPALDFAGINARSRASAEQSVNPFYTKELERFLAEQAAHKQQAEALRNTTVSNLEEDLKNKIEGNAITQQRTGEDVATNLQNIATEQDQFQTDTGQQFAADRLQQSRDTAAAGLTGGLGAQQAEAAQSSRNTKEERVVAKSEQDKQQQQLFKARTFEDLARSNTLGTQATERGKKAADVDLADFITNQGFETEKTKLSLEQQRQEKVAANERAFRSSEVMKAVEAIANPAQRAAAYEQYAGYF